jgi:hypothetical protein
MWLWTVVVEQRLSPGRLLSAWRGSEPAIVFGTEACRTAKSRPASN